MVFNYYNSFLFLMHHLEIYLYSSLSIYIKYVIYTCYIVPWGPLLGHNVMILINNSIWIHWINFVVVVKSLSCVPLFYDPMNCSILGFLVLHYLLAFAQTHVRYVDDAIQPSHPLSPLFPPALSLSQHQGLFQWVYNSF